MAIRKVTEVARETRIFRKREILGRVIALGNEDESWSPVRSGEVLAHLKSGVHSYYTSVPNQPESRIVAVAGDHLRASPDPRSPNNLYSLPQFGLERTPTGDYDMCVFMQAEALAQVMSGLHAAGILPHQSTTFSDGMFFDLSIAVPVVTPSDSSSNEAIVSTEVICWARPADDPFAPGFAAHAVIRSSARFAVGAPNQVAPAHLFAWYAPQTQNQITVTAAIPSQQRMVARALAGWVQTTKPGIFPLQLDPGLGRVETIFTAMLADGTIQVGLTFGNDYRPSRLPAETPDAPFAVSVSPSYLADHIYRAFNGQFGATPPPAGPKPVVVNAADGVAMDSLLIELQDDGVRLSGNLSRDNAQAATFEMLVTLQLQAGELTISVGEIKVDVQGLFNDLANFFSGGQIESSLEEGLRAALVDSEGTGELGSILSASLFSALATPGTYPVVGVTPQLTGLDVSGQGIVLSGVITAQTPPPVEASLTSLVDAPGQDAVLYGAQSWVPGDRIVRTKWEFGDGTRLDLSGPRVALVTRHAYGPGSYQVSLTVVGDNGEQGTATITVDVA